MSTIIDTIHSEEQELQSAQLAEDVAELSGEILYNDLSRREVRSLIFHLLYAMEGFDYETELESIVYNFNSGFELDIPVTSEVFKVSYEVITKRDALDEIIIPFLANWRFERVGVCTKLILRLAIWELQNTDTPSTIVINEAIELAKCFAEKDAYKFVNGLLDKFVKATNPEIELTKSVA
ncbi:MAG: transcription antitermination factor NusB [Candidatus Babeliales bacterium]|nr:transcription antitermination factor NusB [Candidatus Babeliales bacterium]